MEKGRIIGGKLKRRVIYMPGIRKSRPTSSLIKETIFNVLIHRYRVDFKLTVALDLFAGSGALGIEALSLGARSALFVDANAISVRCIRNNLEILGLSAKSTVIHKKLENISDDFLVKFVDIARFAENNEFSDCDRGCALLIFMDPPYNNKSILLEQFGRLHNLLKNAVFVLESDFEVLFDKSSTGVHRLKHGNTFITFLKAD
jgi:16S rRNA (guanine(966)-N(2))-methyltransferase RsmD